MNEYGSRRDVASGKTEDGFFAPLKMTTEKAERQSAVPTETAADEEPCCLTCGEFRMKVIDDFAVGYCPYLAGPMGDPLKVCCEQYYKAASSGK